MSYADLSARLQRLADQLREKAGHLEGQPLAKATATFARAVGSYETKLENHLQGHAPGAREFQDLLKSAQAKKHLTLPALKEIFKSLFSASLKEETPAKGKAALLKRVKETGTSETALIHLQEFFFRAASPASLPADRESLQQEFLRLGSLSDEELDYQLQHQFKTLAALKKLAKANAIHVTPKTSKEKLVEMIVHYARRAHQNVGT